MDPLLFPRKREPCKKVQSVAGQAAIELAVFGAILIFILGTIVRTAVSNGYTQNQNFKAMRMAMLASWQGTGIATGMGASANISRNSASVLFVEDRLSPDFNKYGDLDRNPFIAQGSGTFSYNLFYPWQPGVDNPSQLVPIMDVYINGQHFPFTTAAYFQNITLSRPSCPAGGPYFPPPYGPSPLNQGQCLQNQCLRNAREWAGGIVYENQFGGIIPTALNSSTETTAQSNASQIFAQLLTEGLIANETGTDLISGGAGFAATVTSLAASPLPSVFISWLEMTFPGTGQTQINQIQNILQSNKTQYKLFFAQVVNGSQTAPYFSPTAPSSCSGTYNALCSSLTLMDTSGNPTYTNTNGDMQYDLLRLGDYNSVDAGNTGVPATVETQFPPGVSSCLNTGGTYPPNMRCFVAWQWAASPATSGDAIGINATNNTYPSYDIDGRLKEVSVYALSQNSDGSPSVTYEDPDAGDIDGAWDSNSCGPKPGLQNDAQIYTFTQQGTYLQIKEGKLYDPETDQFVRSANQRDTIDLIQRSIQLSNNTGDFCNGATPRTSVNGSSDPNPVEVCISPGSTDNCFNNEQNIKSTCYDQNTNIIYVRSRLEDRRGHFWMTDTSGQLQVQ